jgi:Fe-S-cluster containining protein
LSSEYQDLFVRPQDVRPARRLPRRRAFGMAQDMKRDVASTASCSRCGTCCRKGGPALHREDRERVAQGIIQPRDLYTIRKGEWASDPMQGGLIRVDDDIIKIKGCGGAWTCRFFDALANACRIYADRPVECTLLECRDTARLEQAYRLGRLTRRDLLADMEGLWGLIEDHGRRCDYDILRGIMEQDSGRGRAEAEGQMAEMIRYDAELRRLMVARGGLEAEMMDFLLGRPVEVVLRLFQRQTTSRPQTR